MMRELHVEDSKWEMMLERLLGILDVLWPDWGFSNSSSALHRVIHWTFGSNLFSIVLEAV